MTFLIDMERVEQNYEVLHQHFPQSINGELTDERKLYSIIRCVNKGGAFGNTHIAFRTALLLRKLCKAGLFTNGNSQLALLSALDLLNQENYYYFASEEDLLLLLEDIDVYNFRLPEMASRIEEDIKECENPPDIEWHIKKRLNVFKKL